VSPSVTLPVLSRNHGNAQAGRGLHRSLVRVPRQDLSFRVTRQAKRRKLIREETQPESDCNNVQGREEELSERFLRTSGVITAVHGP